MNVKLFKATFTLINKCFPPKKELTEDEFLYFLLGYKGNNSENDNFLITLAENLSDCLAGTANLRATLGNQYNTLQSQTQDLQLKDLIKTCPIIDSKDIRDTEARLIGMQGELRKLYEKFSLPYSDSENSEQLFSKLFTACITEKSPCLFSSQKKQQLKPATLKNTLGRSEDSKNLLQCLNQYHKIIISGQHGSGKSRFLQYCLSTWETPDYCYVSYINGLKSLKKSIPFYRDKKQNSITSFEDFKNNSYSSSLLVIDHMNESDDFTGELEELASYSINVIVITTSNMSSNSFHTFRLSPMPDEILMNIFKNTSGISLTDKEQELLFDITQRNVLLISLIAGQYKQLVRKSTDSSEFLSKLLSCFDNTLSVHFPLASDQSSTYKHPYTKKTLDILGHIKSIYANFIDKHKEDKYRCTMRFLCCFGYSMISISFLRLFSNSKLFSNSELFFIYDPQVIDELSDIGWIIKTDSAIQLPSLIARAVFAVENPTVADCYDLINEMNDFLANYDQTLNIPYLSNNLFIFASSIHTKIKVKNNPNQNQASTEFENWQNLIYSIYNYYLENGNFSLAEKIVQMIFYPNMPHKHSELDPSFFQFSIHMSKQSWIREIPKEADRLAVTIENNETLLYANTAPFLIASMDIVIYLYCNLFFIHYNDIQPDNTTTWNIDDLKSYRFTLFNFIGKILHDIPNPAMNKISRLSIPQYEYYQLCHTLMNSPECISSYLFKPLIQEDNIAASVSDNLISRLFTETNANYRIRSIAFTMFMRSIYRKDLQFRSHSSVYPVDPEMLILSIRCDINELHKQIIACEHIPWHTTWICLYCYLQLITELSELYQENHQHITGTYYSYILKSLLYRSTFSKEVLKEVNERISSYFSL